MPTASTLKSIRLIHHYFGVFIAPAVLFFSFTGFIQTFSLHETLRGRDYTPPAILIHLGQLHKKGTLVVPAPRPAPKAAPKPEQTPKLAPVPPATPAPPPSFHWPMKIFFGVVAVGLFTSTLTGLWMAWSYNRNKLLVAAVFLAGLIIPLLLLPF